MSSFLEVRFILLYVFLRKRFFERIIYQCYTLKNVYKPPPPKLPTTWMSDLNCLKFLYNLFDFFTASDKE